MNALNLSNYSTECYYDLEKIFNGKELRRTGIGFSSFYWRGGCLCRPSQTTSAFTQDPFYV